ncbi:hypothetical protein RIF29_13960 [Crotalaria pallida]|uniref:TraB domain-containing protein n=1 Tax=Crotalaria pallida TaxID=3830 RepID=A0AAN9I9V7_CROPI
MNRLLLTRSQLVRVTRWVQTQSFKQCSSASSTAAKIPAHVIRLTCPSTAPSEVRALINLSRPEIVFLELCRSRLSCLEDRKTAKELKVSLGSEFRVACDEAIKHGGIVAIGDRPIEITIMRARRKMPLREIASHFTMFWIFRQNARLLYEVIRKLLEGRDIEFGMLKSNIFRQEYDKTIPTFTEALVHERDLFMSHNLLQVAKKSCCVVAVVGKAHLPGIKKHWKQPVSADTSVSGKER